jgi:hypothetical protein
MSAQVATEAEPMAADTTPETAPQALTAALDYLARGWTPMPIRGKLPLVEWKPFQDTPPLESKLREWWAHWPDADVGLVTGARSGLMVLDLDGAQGTDAVVARAGSSMPRTPTARTGRGAHLYFKHPGGVVGNRAGLLPHVDVRGDGGFVVAPPSVHSNGRRYAWHIPPDTPLANAPGWLLDEILREPVAAPAPVAGFTVPDEIPEGKRHDTLWRMARSLRRKGLGQEAIVAAVRVENAQKCRPPLPEPEVTDLLGDAWVAPDDPGFLFPFHHKEHDPKESISGSKDRSDVLGPTAGAGGFAPLTADELLDMETEPMDWIWKPYLPAGALALLSAFPKVGKSTLAYSLAVAVAQGRPFLGTPTQQGPVLILAVEEHPREARWRLVKFGLRRGDPIYVHVGTVNAADGLREVAEWVQSRGVRLVILDTLTSYWTIDDENNNAQVRRVVKPLADQAHGSRAAWLCIHHETKRGGRGGRGIRGGGGLLGLADQALVLGKHPPKAHRPENERVLEAVGRYPDSPIGWSWSWWTTCTGPSGGPVRRLRPPSRPSSARPSPTSRNGSRPWDWRWASARLGSATCSRRWMASPATAPGRRGTRSPTAARRIPFLRVRSQE